MVSRLWGNGWHPIAHKLWDTSLKNVTKHICRLRMDNTISLGERLSTADCLKQCSSSTWTPYSRGPQMRTSCVDETIYLFWDSEVVNLVQLDDNICLICMPFYMRACKIAVDWPMAVYVSVHFLSGTSAPKNQFSADSSWHFYASLRWLISSVCLATAADVINTEHVRMFYPWLESQYRPLNQLLFRRWYLWNKKAVVDQVVYSAYCTS